MKFTCVLEVEIVEGNPPQAVVPVSTPVARSDDGSDIENMLSNISLTSSLAASSPLLRGGRQASGRQSAAYSEQSAATSEAEDVH